MTIRDVLKRKGQAVFTTREDERLEIAINRLNERHVGSLVVLNDEDRVVGVLSERDVVEAIAERRDQALREPVGRHANKDVYTCEPQDDINKAMNWMTRHRVRHLPVVEGTKLLGLVSIGDLVKERMHAIQDEANILRDMVIAQR